MDTANNTHLPHTTTPSKHHSYLSPPHKKQPNKVGMVPQYPYGLSSLYLSNLNTRTHTHTHAHRPIPAMPHQPYMYPQPIECAWQLQHFTMQHTSPPHTTTYPPHAAIHTRRLDYIHVSLTPHSTPQSTPTMTTTLFHQQQHPFTSPTVSM